MTIAAVNYLNIVLMLVSLALAYVFPFELFLFSYAILGPLHYLTEIGWLHKRNYFTTGKHDYIFLTVLCFLALILFLFTKAYDQHLISGNWVSFGGVGEDMFSPWLRMWISGLIIMAFVAAFAMVLFKDTTNKLIFTLISTGVILLISYLRPYVVILAILLPTLIHTTLFMAAFMLSGSIKGKSFSGYLSVLIFIVCSVAFFIYAPQTDYKVLPFVLNKFLQGDFITLNKMFAGGNNIADALFSPFGLKVQRFIAFAYTYHYLNWFSKTKVIDWNNVTPAWRWFSLIAWILSVALYFIDFKAGLASVFFLAMLHVFLEFPLNFRSLQIIGTSITGIIRKA